MKLILVAAVAENGVIGAAGGMPWRLKSDLAHFRALTIDKPVVMGRKTWQSLPKALPRRTNIVITRDSALRRARRAGGAELRGRARGRPQGRRGARHRRDHGDRRQRHLPRRHAARRPAGNHPRTCYARGGRQISANRSGDMAGGVAPEAPGGAGRQRRFQRDGLFKALINHENASSGRVATRARLPYNPPRKTRLAISLTLQPRRSA